MTNFNRKTNQLLATASHGRIGVNSFCSTAPEIAKQVQSDAGAPWMELWGQSLNFDEFEKAKIVDAKVLAVIGRLAKTQIRIDNSYHAGLIHTYGYLFSTLKTRYGYKRERWTSGIIETGLSLPTGILSPTPKQGTLLNNVTYLLLKISLRDQPAELKKKRAWFSDLHPRLDQLDLTKTKSARITESVQIPTRGRSKRLVEIYTDLIQFRKQQRGTTDALLVYSFKFPSARRSHPTLVTCFPVTPEYRRQLVRESQANLLPTKTRYNAFLQQFPIAGIKGTRKLSGSNW